LVESKDYIEFAGTSFVAGENIVTDYADIIAKENDYKLVWREILDELKNNDKYKNKNINLSFIRQDSPSFKILSEHTKLIKEIDTAPYIDLPKTWEEYLTGLGRKARHELKRKIRRLENENAFKVCFEGDARDFDEFLRLMKLSSEKKSGFLSEEMELFFRNLLMHLLKEKLASLCFLKIEDINIAAIITFQYKDEVLLYNSGYDPNYRHLSPGLLLKAYAIKKAIEQGAKKFDFLRGNERYKYDLGAKDNKLYEFIL
jgi:CelD/BcsL family acetyltransferase involved in cellulose biosynthesis